MFSFFSVSLYLKIVLVSLNPFSTLLGWVVLAEAVLAKAVCCPTIVESVGSQLANFTPPPPSPLAYLTLSPTHEKNEAELASWTVMVLI